MNTKYILIKETDFYVGNCYNNLEEDMEDSVRLLKTGKESSNIVLEVNVLGLLQNLPWGELVWVVAQHG